MRNDAACARWLVQLGADLNARDEWQQSAMLKAVIGGCTECVQLLLENGANTDLVDTVSCDRTQSCLRSTAIKGVDRRHRRLSCVPSCARAW